MHRVCLSLVVLGLLTTMAPAEPASSQPDAAVERGYVLVGGLFGEDQYERFGASAEVGVRLGGLPLFARLVAGVGMHEYFGRSTYRTLRAGLEGRHCLSGDLCIYGGLDLGVVYESVDHTGFFEKPDPMESRGTIVVPRAGFEYGDAWRLRLGLEVPIYNDGTQNNPTTVGAAMHLGIGHSF